MHFLSAPRCAYVPRRYRFFFLPPSLPSPSPTNQTRKENIERGGLGEEVSLSKSSVVSPSVEDRCEKMKMNKKLERHGAWVIIPGRVGKVRWGGALREGYESKGKMTVGRRGGGGGGEGGGRRRRRGFTRASLNALYTSSTP